MKNNYKNNYQNNNNTHNNFLPTTKDEMNKLGWEQCDIILVSGDAYIDSPFIGVAVVGRMLEKLGYKVGIIGQPDINSDIDVKKTRRTTTILGCKWWKH